MEIKQTELLTFFDFPIEQFADRSIRWLLEDKENVRGLLETIVDDLDFDFSQLTHINRSFIPYNLREQESDILYSVPFHRESKTDEVFIYILIEHRSNVEATIAFDMLLYMTQIWEFNAASGSQTIFPKVSGTYIPLFQLCSTRENSDGRYH